MRLVTSDRVMKLDVAPKAEPVPPTVPDAAALAAAAAVPEPEWPVPLSVPESALVWG